MGQPTSRQVHIDQALTQISVAYRQDQSVYVADKVFPNVNVDKQSNKYFTFDKQAFLRDSARRRGNGEESAGSGYKVSTDTYFCDVFALHKDIGDYDRANTDSPLDQDRAAVNFITDQLLLRKEKEWADTYFTTGVWGTDNTTATKWDDYVGSDPLGDIETAKRTVLVNTGRIPNLLVLGYDVFIKLKNHPDIVDRIKYTSSRVVTEDVLASLFGVARVLVAKAILDGASEQKTASLAFIHGKHALLVFVPDAPGLEVPSAGYTFSWSGINPGNASMGMIMRRLRIDERLTDRIEGEIAFDMKVVGSDLGYFFSGIVS